MPHGTSEIFTLILDHHPDINYQDMYCNNALTKATGNFDYYRKMVTMLLHAGIHPDAQVVNEGQINYTVLVKITVKALQIKEDIDYDIIRLFLEKGANPNLADKNGNVPFMKASYKGNISIFILFLEFVANPTLKDNSGKTAKDMVQKKGYQDIVKLLNE